MAQRGRPKKNISEVKALIEDIKPAAVASECVNTQITTVTQAKNPSTDTEESFALSNIRVKIEGWVDRVQNYCSSEAITPIELIEQHKSFKKALNSRKTSENTIELRELKVSPNASVKGGNWYQEFAKRKSQGGSKTEK